MKTPKRMNLKPLGFARSWPLAIVKVIAASGIFILPSLTPRNISASPPNPPGGGGTSGLLDSWSFSNTNWLSDGGHAPVKFTNLVNVTGGGDGNALGLDSTNTTPAFLFYRTLETNGFTNINFATGSVSFWFNPDWSSSNQGGTGPGDWGNLISAGQTGTNGTPWWSLYFSPDGSTLFFSSQTNGGSASTWLSAAVSLTETNWYNVVLTYGATNSALYMNGSLVTNGTGVTVWPGSDVTFFSIGSDSNGLFQAGGKFDDLAAYNYQLGSDFISGNFSMFSLIYYGRPISPLGLTNASPAPPSNPAPRWFSGSGYMQSVAMVTNSDCVTASNVWFTNTSALFTSNGTTFTFTITGGSNNVLYDVFGTAFYQGGSITNSQWAWLGQGYHCITYKITNLLNSPAFFVLGAARDTDSDGLTDAFEALVSKTNPNSANSYGGLPDAWVALNGLIGNSGLASQDPDLDGLVNGQEYLYGTKPLVPEGTSIWVGSPAGTSGLP